MSAIVVVVVATAAVVDDDNVALTLSAIRAIGVVFFQYDIAPMS